MSYYKKYFLAALIHCTFHNDDDGELRAEFEEFLSNNKHPWRKHPDESTYALLVKPNFIKTGNRALTQSEIQAFIREIDGFINTHDLDEEDYISFCFPSILENNQDLKQTGEIQHSADIMEEIFLYKHPGLRFEFPIL